MKKHTILFLAANPLGPSQLALGEEARAIQVELECSGYRDCFALETRWAAQPLDLLRELRKLKPTVVHFSGHGGLGSVGTKATGKRPSRNVVVDARPPPEKWIVAPVLLVAATASFVLVLSVFVPPLKV